MTSNVSNICKQCGLLTKNPVFCNSGCSARFNNLQRSPFSFETITSVVDLFSTQSLSIKDIAEKFDLEKDQIYQILICKFTTSEISKRLKLSKAKRFQETVVSWQKGEYFSKSIVRKYLFSKYEGKCCECGWNKTNPMTGLVPLHVDHVDGNSNNNREENLRLLCPNCHHLTPTWGSLNKRKGVGRKRANESKEQYFERQKKELEEAERFRLTTREEIINLLQTNSLKNAAKLIGFTVKQIKEKSGLTSFYQSTCKSKGKLQNYSAEWLENELSSTTGVKLGIKLGCSASAINSKIRKWKKKNTL